MSPCGSTPIRLITGRPSLFPHSSNRTALSLPCGRPAPRGGDSGLPCFTCVTRGVRPCLSTGGHDVRVPPKRIKGNRPPTFWFKPVSLLGLSFVTVFNSRSLALLLPSSLAPYPHRCSQVTPLPLGLGAARRPGYFVPAASHGFVTNPAWAGRLLMTEHQVPPRGGPVGTIT
jgi:hypothetical protein